VLASAPMIRKALALAGALSVAVVSIVACEKKLDPKECNALRAKAFELVNSAHLCNADADCVQSEWPGCEKPLSKKHAEEISPMQEPKVDCRKPPPVYCKQGLCVHREAGTPEGQGPAGGEGIKIE
jgi:hypothetical protein